MPKYTFTFDRQDEKRFNSVLSRLDPDYYTIHQPIQDFEDPKRPGEKRRNTIMEMESEDSVQFRLSMGNDINIRRERTEEELAEEKALEEANTVKITVKVNGLPPATP
jgi:hypothetical protein